MVSDPAFAPETLIVWLRLGAVATLNLYPPPVAISTVFTLGLDRLAGNAHIIARDTVAAHVDHASRSAR